MFRHSLRPFQSAQPVLWHDGRWFAKFVLGVATDFVATDFVDAVAELLPP